MTTAATRIASIDPDDPGIPETIAPPEGGAGEVVVLLAEEGAHSVAWPSRLAVRMAGDWADRGTRVTLMDGDLSEAALHQVLEAENEEGTADLVLYGASPRRVARPVEGHGFLFVPSGTVVADPSAAYGHPRWKSIVGAFRESGTVLLLYLPAEARGVEELAATADRVVRLSPFRPDREPDWGVTVIHPEGRYAGSGIEVVTEDGAVPVGDPKPSEDPVSLGASVAGTDSEGGSDRRTEGSSEGSVLMGPNARGSGSWRPSLPWVFLVLLVVLGAVLVAAWFGLISIPGLTPATFAG